MSFDIEELSTTTLFDGEQRNNGSRAPGKLAGRYVLQQVLGSGGMGEVWGAWDPQLDREIALKFLRRFNSDAHRQRLLREAQAMARVRHPNIVAVYDIGEVDGGLYVAMEKVDGETLRLWQAVPGRPWQDIVRAYTESARALAAAHAVGLVHRDFKPDNAMVERSSGRVRVMDFGLAAAIDGHTTSSSPPFDAGLRSSSGVFDTPLTVAGVLLGTPAYMAPEQLSGERTGAWTDQFALCLSLWEALFGERPFPGETIDELLDAMLDGSLRAPTNPRVPARIVQALTRGLAAEPTRRWPTIDALIGVLEAPQKRNLRLRVAGAGSLLIGSLAASVYFGSREPDHCDDPHPRFASSWSESQHASLELLLRDASPYGADAAPRVVAELDRWTERWAAVASAACRGSDAVPEALDVAQALCLERDLDALDLTLALLAEAKTDPDIVLHAVEMVQALPNPERCAEPSGLVEIEGQRLRDPDVADALQRELLSADVLARAGRWDEVVTALTPEVARAGLVGQPRFEAALLLRLGWAHYERREADSAIELLTRAYELALSGGADDIAAQAAVDLMYANTRGEPRLEQARAWDVHARALLERNAAAPLERAGRLAALGFIAEMDGAPNVAREHYEAAERLLTEAGPAASLRRARLIDDLGAVLVQVGEIERGRTLQLESMQSLAQLLGETHPDLASAHYKLGSTAFGNSEISAAKEHFQRAIAIAEPTLGSDAALTLAARTGLGATRLADGDYEGARDMFEPVLAAGERRFGALHLELVPPLVNLCVAEIALAELEMAEIRCRRALEILEAAHGPEHPGLLAALDNLGDIRAQRGDAVAAKQLYERSLKLGEASYGANNPELDYALIGLGEAALALGEPADARLYFARVTAGRNAEGKHIGLLARGEFGLAKLAAQEGLADEALAHGQRALTDMQAAPKVEQGMLAEITTWVDERD